MSNWLNKTEYPFTSRFYNTSSGHRLHYIDEGNGTPVLFVHGTPSWSFDFRNVIKPVSKLYRCIAPDHIGFGLSDKPAGYDYSIKNHAATLEKFITNMKLDNFHLVVHDFGGAIGLHYAIKFPEKIKSITILNSWLWPLLDSPEYKKEKKLMKSPLLSLVYKWFNFSPRFILPKSFADPGKLTKEIHRHYLMPFKKIKDREAPLACAKALLHESDWYNALWQNVPVLKNKPVLFIWGMKDAFVRSFNLEKFITAFSNPRVIQLDDCGHFPQEEAAEQVANELSLFLSEQSFS
jgi:haloalkane dehalogenase